ncbi:MAG: ECF transporter S component [Prevotella sp.]|nr:ECF transporter S component [Prevotella sp.]
METNARLYTLRYDEARTYLWTTIFVACNLLLPQLFHLIPQGGIIFAPLSLVILASSYKLGWRVGLLAAILSPIVNHIVTGMPALAVMPLMTTKLALLALIAGFTAQHFRKATLPLIIAVVLAAHFIGGLAELSLTGNIIATTTDFTLGWPGLLLQILGTYFVCKYL